jgi:hypothetical protein
LQAPSGHMWWVFFSFSLLFLSFFSSAWFSSVKVKCENLHHSNTISAHSFNIWNLIPGKELTRWKFQEVCLFPGSVCSL